MNDYEKERRIRAQEMLRQSPAVKQHLDRLIDRELTGEVNDETREYMYDAAARRCRYWNEPFQRWTIHFIEFPGHRNGIMLILEDSDGNVEQVIEESDHRQVHKVFRQLLVVLALRLDMVK